MLKIREDEWRLERWKDGGMKEGVWGFGNKPPTDGKLGEAFLKVSILQN